MENEITLFAVKSYRNCDSVSKYLTVIYKTIQHFTNKFYVNGQKSFITCLCSSFQFKNAEIRRNQLVCKNLYE